MEGDKPPEAAPAEVCSSECEADRGVLRLPGFESHILSRQRVNSAGAEGWSCPGGVSDAVPGSSSKGVCLKVTSG